MLIRKPVDFEPRDGLVYFRLPGIPQEFAMMRSAFRASCRNSEIALARMDMEECRAPIPIRPQRRVDKA